MISNSRTVTVLVESSTAPGATAATASVSPSMMRLTTAFWASAGTDGGTLDRSFSAVTGAADTVVGELASELDGPVVARSDVGI
ncbi:hypothetical protein ACFWUP_00360 [Nocardia sp. NPDC058658]|uniref:hypothetical protein n=1 Tax=Nocardia sp. NPDC058658 TaxID=3346580 RepID=UPI0036601612